MYCQQDREWRTDIELDTNYTMWMICSFSRVAGRKDIGLQRQTNKEERRIDEREDYSETDWLRTTDATRKEEKIRGKSKTQ